MKFYHKKRIESVVGSALNFRINLTALGSINRDLR